MYQTKFDETHYELGTSGFLFRSNKLMYDEATKSLWSTMMGEPVVGSLVGQGIKLNRFHVVTTNWGEWKKRHPDTLVLSIETGHERNYDEGFAYRDYFATDKLMIAVPVLDERLKNKDSVLALRNENSQLAIHEGFLRRNPVFQDQLDDVNFVVLTDASGGNRVYDSDNVKFESWNQFDTAISADGSHWEVTEDALTNQDGIELKRLPAHRSFWFGWFSQYPETRLVK